MRVEQTEIGSIMHTIKRGARDMPIFASVGEKWRTLRVLFYMNDNFIDWDWNHYNLPSGQTTWKVVGNRKEDMFFRPSEWPERETIVDLLGYVFLDNHIHMLCREKIEKGISLFMKKVSQSMTENFNRAHHKKGSIFQGAYKGRVVDTDQYLRWVVPYVLVKNTFEMHPRGYKWAVANFEEAWKWAVAYPFSSLGDYVEERKSKVINTTYLKNILGGPKEFKCLCKDMILGRVNIVTQELTELKRLSFE